MIDGDSQPHLMDFGLARRDVGEVTVTLDGQILGTPAYMSPEQAQGEAHKADRRSDVYSLGVILFQLLTGELPFRGNARMIMHQVIHDEPPSPRRLNANIKRDLETVTLKCLEKDASRRYGSAREVADELHRVLRSEPIRARAVGRLNRGWRWCKRNPAIAVLAALVLVSAALGFAGVTSQWRKAVAYAGRESVARQQAERARLEVSKAALAGFNTAADSLLIRARTMRGVTPQEASQNEALRLLTKAGSIARQAEKTVGDLGKESSQTSELAAWAGRLRSLRDEATKWLAEPRIWRTGTITLPEVELPNRTQNNVSSEPVIGISADGGQIAVYYPQENEAFLLDRKGAILQQHKLSFTQSVASPSYFESRPGAWSPGLSYIAVANSTKSGYVVEVAAIKSGKVERLSLPEELSFEDGLPQPQLHFIASDQLILTRRRYDPEHEYRSALEKPSAPVLAVCVAWRFSNGNWEVANAELLVEPGDSPRSVYKKSLIEEDPAQIVRLNGNFAYGYAGTGVYYKTNDRAQESFVPIKPGNYYNSLTLKFSADATTLAVKNEYALQLIHLATGAVAYLPWVTNDQPRRFEAMQLMVDQRLVSVYDLTPFKTGLITLERFGTRERTPFQSPARWQIGIWQVAFPKVPLRMLPDALTIRYANYFPRRIGICVSGDGSIITTGVSRPTKWQDNELTWQRQDNFFNWTTAFSDDLLVAWQTGPKGKVILRYLTKDSVQRLPAHESQRLVSVSENMRWAVLSNTTPNAKNGNDIVSREAKLRDKMNAELELWSLATGRVVAKLGSYHRAFDFRGEEVEPAVRFSPQGDWLVIKQDSQLALWQLPDATFVKSLEVPQDYDDFDFSLGKNYLLISRRSYRDSDFVVVDLNRAKILRKADISKSFEEELIVQSVARNSLLRVTTHREKGIYLRAFAFESEAIDEWQVAQEVWDEHVSPSVEGIFNADGSRLLLYGRMRGREVSKEIPCVQLWDVQKKQLLREYKGEHEENSVNWRIFSDTTAVSLGFDSTPLIPLVSWNWADGADAAGRDALLTHDSGNDPDWALEFRGNQMLLCNRESMAKVPIQNSPQENGKMERPTSFHVSPTDSTVAFHFKNGPARLFNAESGQPICEFAPGHRVSAFDRSGKWCATIDENRTIHLWDTEAGKRIRETKFESPIGGNNVLNIPIEVDSSGKYLTLRSHGALFLWDVLKHRVVQKLEPIGHIQALTSIAHDPTNDLLVTGGSLGEIAIWNVDSGELTRSIVADIHSIEEIVLNPAGDRLAYRTAQGRLELSALDGNRIWSTELKRPSNPVNQPQYVYGAPPQESEQTLAFHPSGAFLAVVDRDTIRFLDANSGKAIGSQEFDNAKITALEFAPDGSSLAVATVTGRVHQITADTELRSRTIAVGSPVSDIAFECGPDLLVTAADTFQFWEVSNSQPLITFSPTGPRVVEIMFDAVAGNMCALQEDGDVLVYHVASFSKQLDNLGLGLRKNLPSKPKPLNPNSAKMWLDALAKIGTKSAPAGSSGD
jgi:WD40 repeat protein